MITKKDKIKRLKDEEADLFCELNNLVGDYVMGLIKDLIECEFQLEKVTRKK